METKKIYCHRCRKTHPESEMRLVSSKSGKFWRCSKSIQGGQKTLKDRDAFGGQFATRGVSRTKQGYVSIPTQSIEG